jgi:RNA polymerase sigma factor (sigma-70 family)
MKPLPSSAAANARLQPPRFGWSRNRDRAPKLCPSDTIIWYDDSPGRRLFESEAGGLVEEREEARARFAKLIVPHLSAGYRLARSMTASQADAEDAVQDACLRAFRAIGNVADGTARAWFLSIVHNTTCSWLRKNRPAALIAVEDLEAAEGMCTRSGHEAETPEAALVARTDQIRLQAAIASLTLPFRETLLLRDVEGLEYREIAEVTGVPVGTVMSRLARARRRLMASLGKLEP